MNINDYVCPDCGLSPISKYIDLWYCLHCGASNEEQADALEDCYDEGDAETFAGILSERVSERVDEIGQIEIDLGLREEMGFREMGIRKY